MADFLEQSASLNFFNKISQNESLALLQECVLDQTKIFFVQENDVQAFVCNLVAQISKQRFYIESDQKKLNIDYKYSFCLKVFGKVYFFKSELAQDEKGIYLNENIIVYELQRRKHTRFDIPETWDQNCLIFQYVSKAPKIRARIINISWSGIRLSVEPQFPEYKLKQKIQFSIRIHRKPAYLATAEIVYVKKNKITGPILGLQFINNSILFKNKIQNTCDDLLHYYAINQKNEL